MSGDQVSLVTAFYANVLRWAPGFAITGFEVEEAISSVLEEVGEILSPGGQFVLTSCCSYVKRPSWAREEFRLTGTCGKCSKTLELPFPEWLKEHSRNLICADLEKKDYSGLDFFLEDEIAQTQGRTIGLIRDMMVRVYTK